jgi:aerobic-type carbon monoxide dehydrogenase small subunit (CoxS/CutS family)
VLVRLRINGEHLEADVPATALLLDLIRDRGLTGTKAGCRIGVCGVCTVLVDDLPVSSCLYLAHCADGADVWTVEGIARRDPEIVDAFVRCEGMQCGICTPGQVVTTVAARAELGSHPAAAELREYFAGNLCRCTGYQTIMEAAAGDL